MATHMKQHTEAAPGTKTQAHSGLSLADAIAQLKSDHRLVEELFQQIESATQKGQRQGLIRSVCQELTLHAALEEHFFYPEARKALGDEADIIDEAVVEHSSLKWLIAQLETESIDSDLYEAKITVLKEYVSHHVKEEENELFPKLKKSSLDMVALGKTLAKAKQDLQTQLYH
jgi:hemerythrin superfamily protein